MLPLALVVALSLAAPPRPSPGPAAPAPVAPAVDGTAAFERLKKLEGGWKSDAKEPQFVMLRLVANGTAVLETVTGADRTAVLSATIYAFEGTELVATHYGSGGTSHLKLKELDASTLRFEGTSKEARLAAVTVTTKDPKLKLEITVRENGREAKRALELLREYVDTLK
ncbi:MAG: hypothetical protein ACOZQL_13495 [Myxococcota bacterium]